MKAPTFFTSPASKEDYKNCKELDNEVYFNSSGAFYT